MDHAHLKIVALGTVLGLSSTALAAFPSFDDLATGTTYAAGDSFISDGIAVQMYPFQYADGSWTSGGDATVSAALWAHGANNELNTNNINARYNFEGSIGTQTQVALLFGEYGGNINFAINGDQHNINNFIDINGAVIGGCTVSVVSGGFGGDAGELVVLGEIRSMVIGGQELAVDIPGDDECEPAFEDLPLDMVYVVGDTFTSGGLPAEVVPFIFIDGTAWPSGHVRVENWNLACGTGQELFTNNANVAFNFASVSPVDELAFEFGEYGGNINVEINGDFRNVADYRDLDGAVIGGITFNVVSGGWGNDCGRVECDGVINTMTLGGQEHFIDCLEFNSLQIDDCEPSYEDLPLGSTYYGGNSFATADYGYEVQHFTWSHGVNTYSGYVAVENGGMSCSADQELRYNNATTLIKRLDGHLMKDVSFKFGEHGGNINLEINGDFRNFDNMIDIDGLVIGGVAVSIDWGGAGADCGQVSLNGDLEYLRIGGQEFWVDCFAADFTEPPVLGDIDGDGDADINDLLALLAAWGSSNANADLNGDGTVDINDLLVMLSAL